MRASNDQSDLAMRDRRPHPRSAWARAVRPTLHPTPPVNSDAARGPRILDILLATVCISVLGSWLERGWRRDGGRRQSSPDPSMCRAAGVTELMLAEERLRESEAKYRRTRRTLERQVLDVAAERQRGIGQELHDGIGQELTGLGLMADALAQRMDRTRTAEGLLAAKVAAGIERVHQQVRAIAYRIVPAEVDPHGLCASLGDLVRRTCEQAGNACTFDASGPTEPPDTEAATHLFGIAQEALGNALRHGGGGGDPDPIRMTLRGDRDALVLTIEDHGVGLPPGSGSWRTRGLGIRMMHYRASAIGATLNIGPSDGGGTTVRCFLARRPRPSPADKSLTETC
jgi:signal transduction histidine kinase